MQTQIEFQEALSLAVEKIRGERYALNDPSLYGINYKPADKAGKLLVQAKEFLTSAEYEEMLDNLSINPLEAAFLVDRLSLSTKFAISRDLEQEFHQKTMTIIREWKDVCLEGLLPSIAEALQVMIRKLMEVAEEEDKDLPVLLPRMFTREELRAIYAQGDPLAFTTTITSENDAIFEEKIEQEIQEQEKLCAKLSSGHYHRDKMAEFIIGLKDVFEHPEDYTPDEEEEEEANYEQ